MLLTVGVLESSATTYFKCNYHAWIQVAILVNFNLPEYLLATVDWQKKATISSYCHIGI